MPLLEIPADLVWVLLREVYGQAESAMDAPSFRDTKALQQAAGFKWAMAFRGMPLTEFCRLAGLQGRALLCQERGLWIYRWDGRPGPGLTFDQSNTLPAEGLRVRLTPSTELVTGLTIKYAQDPARGDYREALTLTAPTAARYADRRGRTRRDQPLGTLELPWVRDPATAAYLGAWRLGQLDHPRLLLTVTGTWEALTVEKGDLITCAHPLLAAYGGPIAAVVRRKAYRLAEDAIELEAVDAPSIQRAYRLRYILGVQTAARGFGFTYQVTPRRVFGMRYEVTQAPNVIRSYGLGYDVKPIESQVSVGLTYDVRPPQVSGRYSLAYEVAPVTKRALGYRMEYRLEGEEDVPPSTNDFRLTLASGDPVPAADQTAKSTLYLTPHLGQSIMLYVGAAWVVRTPGEVSLSLSALAADTVYDIFVWDSAGTIILEAFPWASATARATPVVRQDGVWVKSGQPSRRWVGTISTTVAGQTEDSPAKRYVWNAQNRAPRPLRRAEAAGASWSYATSNVWRQANANTANEVAVVVGLLLESLVIQVLCVAYHSAAGAVGVGIGEDVTNAVMASAFFSGAGGASGTPSFPISATFSGLPASIGRHRYVWLERMYSAGTAWYSSEPAGGYASRSGLVGTVWA
jgi:hypothetical protein